jgi:hypothetical protein
VDGGRWRRLESQLMRRRNDALAAIEAARPTPRRPAVARPRPLTRLALVPPADASSVPPAGGDATALPSHPHP